MKTEEFSVSKTFNNSTIYFVTNVLQKAISFFLLPLYTVYLSTADYGLVSLILSFLGVVTLLITLALNGSVSRYYFVYKKEEKKQKQFIGTVVITIIINSLVWFILLVLFHNIISEYFLQNISFYPFVFVALLSTVTAPVYLLYQTILQIKQRAKAFAANSLSFFILAITLNILLIVVFRMGALGMLLAISIPNMLFSVYAVFSLIKRKHIVFVFRLIYLKEALKFSIPLIPHVLSGTIADYISRNVLYLKTNLSNVGLYNVAFQFGSIINIVVNSVYYAFLPFIYNSLDEKGEKLNRLIKLNTLILNILVIVALILSLFSK
jgi:O-antigen/teichoic acid export membrane protein